MTKRINIKPSVKIQILTEAGYMCANPRCKHILTLELHHIEWIKDNGSNDPSNLIALCSNCHDLHTKGHIHKSSIHVWKQMLQIVNAALDRESLDILIFLFNYENKSLEIHEKWEKWNNEKKKELNLLKSKDETTHKEIIYTENKWNSLEPKPSQQDNLRVTGDGLLKLVRLIRTGLVNEGDQKWAWSDAMWFYYWEPSLTKTGRKLAEAYLQGNAKVFKEILSGNFDTLN